MAGTTIGGLKTVETNKKKYGEDFYVRIGAKGGAKTAFKKGFPPTQDQQPPAGVRGGPEPN